jgi:hypothetical protein
MKKILTILLLICSLTLSAQTKWYVTTTGSDSHGKGTVGDPWLTLHHAADTVVGANFDNDTIIIGVGTFTETNRIDLGVQINIKGAGATSIIISTYAAATYDDASILLSSASGDPTDGSQSISNIYLDGSDTTGTRAILINFRKNIKIFNCTIIDFRDSGIRFNCHNTNWNVAPTNLYSTGNEVHDCIIRNCSGHITYNGGLIRAEGTEGMLVYNNTLDQTARAAGDNSDCMTGYWNKGLQLYNNTWNKNDLEGADYIFFFELHYGQGGMDIYDNTFNGAGTLDISGVVKGTYDYGAKVYNNDFLVAAPAAADPAYSPCITLESFDEENDIYIYQNYFKNVRGGIYLDNVFTSAENIYIYYNIFENVGNATDNFGFGILIKSYWEATDAGVPFDNIFIYNNTIDCGTEAFDGIGAYIDGTITNLNIRNNIINGNFEDRAIDFKLGGGAVAATINTLNINNNTFYGTASNSFAHVAGITINTESTTGNLTSDPLFKSSGDFHLQSGSPAINAGIDVGLTSDYSGFAKYGANWDIGALEYQSYPHRWWISTTGSDTDGDGSYSAPWRTLHHAADTITGASFHGDTIIVGAGTFTETEQITLGVEINIKGAGITSIIESTYAAAYHTGLITAASALGNAVDGNQSISYLAFDGNLTGTRAIEVDFRNNVVISNCTFTDFLYSGITFYGTNQNWNVTPTNTVPTGCKVFDCTFTNCTQLSGHAAPGHIRAEGTNGLEIYNNNFDQTGRAAGENHDIFVAYQNYGMKVYNNTWTKNSTNGAAWNFFAEQHYTLGGFEMYGNTFNGGACWDLSGVVKGTYSFGAQVHDNVFTTVGEAPTAAHDEPYIDLESFDYENDIYVYRNLFRNGRTGIKLGNVQTSTDNIWIYYNVFENIGNSTDNWGFGIFIHSYYNGVAKPMSNIYVYNNVIDAATEAYAGIGIWMMGDITNLKIKNNIINGNFEDYAISARLQAPAAAATIAGLDVTNNDLYGTGGDSFYHVAGITITGENVADNITTDPLFVSTTDFHLQSASPAINAGIDVGLTTDYSGHHMYGAAWDVGAYEWGRWYLMNNGKIVINDGKIVVIEQ